MLAQVESPGASEGDLGFYRVTLPTLGHQIRVDGAYEKYDELEKNPELLQNILGSYVEGNPIPIVAGTRQDRHFEGSYLFLHLSGRFFHDFLDIFSVALSLKALGESFTLGLVCPPTGIMTPSGHPRGMFFGLKERITIQDPAYPQAFLYIASFLDYLEVPHMYISVEDLNNASCDVAYFPYIKMASDFTDSYRNDLAIDYVLYKNKAKVSRSQIMLELVDYSPTHRLLAPINSWLSSSILYAQVKTLREAFSPEKITDTKIYVSRKNFLDRNNSEEPLLENYFSSIGYQIVYLEQYPVWEQIKLITTAKKVVMFCGGSQALTYLCSRDTDVVWLRPSSYELIDTEIWLKQFFNLDISVIDFNIERDSILKLAKKSIID